MTRKLNMYTFRFYEMDSYTFNVGNGVTLTIAAEDPTTAGYQSTASAYAPMRKSGASFTYGGLNVPDIVADLAVKQAWGSAKLAAALHQDYGSVATPYTKMGFGVQAGVNVNIPMLAAGDTIGIQGAYSLGATGLAYTWGYQGAGTFASTDLGADAAVASGVLKQAQEWSIGAAFAHNFTKTIEFDITPSYYAFSNSNTAGALKFQAFELGTQVDWRPVAGIEIIPDFEYRNVQTSASTRAAGNATFSNANGYVFDLRIKRSF